MTARPFMAPLFLSVAMHAAALSGVLLAGAGMAVLARDMPVVLVTIESPGEAGASGTPGARKAAPGPGRATGVPGIAAGGTRPDARYGDVPAADEPSVPARHERVVEDEPAEAETMAVPASGAGPSENAPQAAGHRETPASGTGAENAGGHGSGHPGDSASRGKADGGGAGNGTGGAATGAPSPAAVAEMAEPAYPRLSRIHGEEGIVLLEAEITFDGKPARVRILRSSGYRRLDDAAVAALKRATFFPARPPGGPVASTKRVSIRFELREREERNRR